MHYCGHIAIVPEHRIRESRKRSSWRDTNHHKLRLQDQVNMNDKLMAPAICDH